MSNERIKIIDMPKEELVAWIERSENQRVKIQRYYLEMNKDRDYYKKQLEYLKTRLRNILND